MLLKQGAVTPLTATSISLTQPSPVSQLPMCSIPPVSATAVRATTLQCTTLTMLLHFLELYYQPNAPFTLKCILFFQGFPQLPEANIVNTSHRAALQHANATSCGYFVSQDSSFGNQILPVLPRFDSK